MKHLRPANKKARRIDEYCQIVRTLSRALKCQSASSCWLVSARIRFEPTATGSRLSMWSWSMRYSTSARGCGRMLAVRP